MGKDYIPPTEFHHINGSGKGDTIEVTRYEHEWIHQDVAGACRSLGEKTKGFAGDPTTLKLGNKFFGGGGSGSGGGGGTGGSSGGY